MFKFLIPFVRISVEAVVATNIAGCVCMHLIISSNNIDPGDSKCIIYLSLFRYLRVY